MVNTTDILDALAKIVEEVTGIDSADVTTEKSFTDDLDIDSLSMVEITVQLEDTFEVQIPDDQAAKLRTVGDAVSYVVNHHKAGRP
ncbi:MULTISPECIES: acyl carrier protein [Streptomyces]|uniref:Acyl carrier protein n=1 Tax=Streptomyces morookaense TaxID=1970 RepID=A0A7Y7B9K0_STRMO|nr:MULTISPECIES: acyl carrier protein [Streptomyces]MCC2280404.1 acyl carrier protein [Streptomyces sp. ET3-23]NVK81484.1 acyl carrier protein [Streptomyces morookaense]GHF24330.1 acyl carrier protein [Streptomyces morookaense]